jgi:hypothetical protein
MKRQGKVQSWPAETMYEHVNGEAELLKRYGAFGVSYALYEGAGETVLSVDIIDLGESLNAFGLLSLYTGCDGDPEKVDGTLLYPGTWTSYGRRDGLFIRVDVDAPDGPGLTRQFIKALSRGLPEPSPLPPEVDVFRHAARRPCEVGYHPEDVDYDLDAGPGYTWTGTEGQACFARVLLSRDEAVSLMAALEGKGVKTVRAKGRVVAWSKEAMAGTGAYLENVLEKVVEAIE